MSTSRFIRAPLAALFAIAALPLFAAPFTPGNVVVYRVGTGGTALVNTGNPVFLDEFSADGTLVQSVAVPAVAAGANKPLVASGTATSEGLLSRSDDGRYLVLTGYGRAPGGSGSLPSTTAAAVNRVIGRAGADGVVDTSTALTDYATGNNPRSVASVDGESFWAVGGAGGVRHAAFGSVTSSDISTTVANLRQAAVFGGQLYISTSSGSAVRIGSVGTGAPTTSGQAIATLPGLPVSTGSPYAFALLDLDAGEPGIDTLYVADDAAGIIKYSKTSGTWSARGTVGSGSDAYRGIAAIVDGSTVTLYATGAGGSAAAGGGKLVRLVDASGYGGTLTGTPTVLATAANQTAYRGIALAPVVETTPDVPAMRITEWAYNGDEFIEFTNVGDVPVDMAGWKYDDDSADPAVGMDLSAFGVVAAGESVILAERSAELFRTSWDLCEAAKVIGGSTVNLGRADQINLFDATGTLVDRLSFGDNTAVGGPRTDDSSAWVSAAGLGVDNAREWTKSTANDAEASWASTTAPTFFASPGKSTRATVAFEACTPVIGDLTISVDQPIVSGSVGDAHNPTAKVTVGGADAALLSIAVTSSNPSVIAATAVTITGSGAERDLSFAPTGRGVATLTLTVSDGAGASRSTTLTYASSNPAPDASAAYYHRISDASGALDVGGDHSILVNDETNTIFLHRSSQTGLPVKTWDFTSTQMGTTSEVDFEGITRSGNLVLITGSHGNNRSGAARPERRTLIAATVSGAGAATELSFRGRYNGLWDELRAWDQGNAHGLGANALGFIAGTAGGVEPNAPNGFNIEGLEFAPNGTTAYLGFRAPTINVGGNYRALIVPLLNPADLTAAAPGTGPAQFGAPILMDLGGRSIRAIGSNAYGDYIISAGPTPQNATWALYTWDGNPAHAPQFNRELPAEDALTGGTWEAVGAVPSPLVEGAMVRVVTDSGDTNYYGTGATKDLAAPYQKSYSQLVPLAAVPGGSTTTRPSVRITEWMYAGDEFIEFTNVGNTAVDMTGWRFDDSRGDPALGVDLGSFGILQPGESALVSESSASLFRSNWNLCEAVKIIGNNPVGLGRADQINLYDASGKLVDRLTYGDETVGGPRTQNRAGWVSASALGADNVLGWTLATVGDGEASWASVGNAEHIGSPGKSSRAAISFDACAVPTEFVLDVSILSGTGTVTGQGIDCPGDCTESYAAGTSVSLAASPASGYVFDGWSGACLGNGGCSVVMSEARSVGARFVAAPSSDLSVAISARTNHIARNEILDYQVSITNNGPDATTAAGVATILSDALDVAQAHWACVGPSSSGCTASGTGNLADGGLSIPVGGSVTWVVSAPARADAEGLVISTATVTDAQDGIVGNNSTSSSVPVVIFVDGFDLPIVPNVVSPDGESSALVWQPLAPQALIETSLAARAVGTKGSATLTLDVLRGGGVDKIRLLVRSADAMSRMTPWLVVEPGMPLGVAIGHADDEVAERPLLLRAGAQEAVIPAAVGRDAKIQLIAEPATSAID